jgi:hypothetical protein
MNDNQAHLAMRKHRGLFRAGFQGIKSPGPNVGRASGLPVPGASGSEAVFCLPVTSRTKPCSQGNEAQTSMKPEPPHVVSYSIENTSSPF